MTSTVTIQSLTAKGDGVAACDGQPVYVSRAAPGDELRLSLTQGKNATLGHIEEIVSPGPDRIAAPCPHYVVCGGCQIQHLEMQAYRSWKENSVRDMIAKAGVTPDTWLPPVFIPQATRRRVTFGALRRGQDLTLGLNGYRSDKIYDQHICLLLTPALNDMRDRLRPYLLRILPDGKLTDVSLQDIDGSIEVILTGDFRDIAAARMQAITEAIHALGLCRIGWRAAPFDPPEIWLSLLPATKAFGKLVVDVPPAAFLQPSREGEAALVDSALAGCTGGKKLKILDLFAGCGTFSGPLLAHGSVHAVETDRASVQALQKAMSRARGLSVERRDLFREPVTVRELNAFDYVVFDPPRAGAKAQCEMLAKSKVPRIAGVSCNPFSFITDAKILMQGGYRLETLQLVDQFIWSSHSEVVGIFSKAG